MIFERSSFYDRRLLFYFNWRHSCQKGMSRGHLKYVHSKTTLVDSHNDQFNHSTSPFPRLSQDLASLSNTLKNNHGLDLFQLFSIETYNKALNEPEQSKRYKHLPRLPTTLEVQKPKVTATCGEDSHDNPYLTIGILIGNSKAIWEPFLNSLRKKLSIENDPLEQVSKFNLDHQNQEHHDDLKRNPLDTFVRLSIQSSLPKHWLPIRNLRDDIVDTIDVMEHNEHSENPYCYDVYFPYETGNKFIHFQLLAHASGLAYLNENCNLCVHSQYGPWIALRAVLLLHIPLQPNMTTFLKTQTHHNIIQHLKTHIHASHTLNNVPLHDEMHIHDSDFNTHILKNPFPENDQTLHQLSKQFHHTYQSISEKQDHATAYQQTWKQLLEIRNIAGDFFPATMFRYSDDQIQYHYLKNVDWLLNKLKST